LIASAKLQSVKRQDVDLFLWQRMNAALEKVPGSQQKMR
jgi:hypothetical protein